MRDAGVYLRWLGCMLICICILSGIEYLTLLAMVLYTLGIILSEKANRYEISRIDHLEEKVFKRDKDGRPSTKPTPRTCNISFGDLNPGDLFTLDDDVFMKMETQRSTGLNAVNLDSGIQDKTMPLHDTFQGQGRDTKRICLVG